MPSNSSHSSADQFSNHASPLFGTRLWIQILAFSATVVVLFLLPILFICCYRRKPSVPRSRLSNPAAAKSCFGPRASSLDHRLLSSFRLSDVEMEAVLFNQSRAAPARESGVFRTSLVADPESVVGKTRLALDEIKFATNGFACENVIGCGDHAVVYRGVLLNNVRVAVKRLLCSSLEDEEFKREVEVISHVRHKNLVKLIGYCAEGDYRVLVYEYVDNGNLHQWLHDCSGKASPLTWGQRINIIRGMAKGLAYIHEDAEPKVVHCNIKSSNILLDHQWNPKISDMGSAELYEPEPSHMSSEQSSYAAPDYDVYCFGVLVMEIVTGRLPVDESQPQAHLIDWLKFMIANQRTVHVVDSNIPERPSSKELKRVLLIALRCVDPDLNHRPRMGDVVHMLETRDLLIGDVRSFAD
ncbi:probable serine/threonine-protein kinase At1g01540 [Eucalyptus grandis]|uniref:probable serine/threonine-protein kinase At1g01540 n=1 Tax=Eucalyptus grandis TaxID=71139 RepID=UPI0008A0DD69|nr:probable serine/threonine-protein kinase At1g01540 [Eucalyptus grandis]